MPLFPDEIEQKPNRARRRRKPIMPLALIALGALLLVAALVLGRTYTAMEAAASPSPSPSSDVQAEENGAGEFDGDGFAEVDWAYWKSVNPDVIGWVNVPGTSISQPICQAPADDPDFYNYHDAYRSYNLLGCPFLHADSAATGLTDSRNAVVQGHNISNSSSPVFAEFSSFAGSAFAHAHSRILLQTPERKMTLEAFCVEVIPNAGTDGTLATTFESSAQFQRYVSERCANASVVLSDAPDDMMWTFSTCSYFLTPENERTVVHCKLLLSAAGSAL